VWKVELLDAVASIRHAIVEGYERYLIRDRPSTNFSLGNFAGELLSSEVQQPEVEAAKRLVSPGKAIS
jgi:hypothetical protein